MSKKIPSVVWSLLLSVEFPVFLYVLIKIILCSVHPSHIHKLLLSSMLPAIIGDILTVLRDMSTTDPTELIAYTISL